MIAGVGSCGSWEDPCSLDQWDPSIPWCGHVLLMKGVFFGPKFGPQIWDGPNTGVFKQICMICSSRDWSKCGCGWCGCGCLSGAEYDRVWPPCQGLLSLLWHGSNLLHCPNQRWRPWSFQNSTIQVWVVSTDEDSNTASPDTFDGSSSIYIYR